MSPIEILLAAPVCVSAAASATTIWLKGSLFAGQRAAWQAMGGWRAKLTRCPLCASGQASIAVGVLLLLAALLPDPWRRIPLVVLVASSVPAPALLLARIAMRQSGENHAGTGSSEEPAQADS